MKRLAVTGHCDLSDETRLLVAVALQREIERYATKGLVTGFSCCAPGADELFARAVLDAGGSLIVIVPRSDYRIKLSDDYQPTYDEFLAQARAVVSPTCSASSWPEAYRLAGACMVEIAEQLIAVYDGTPTQRVGGTADVVSYAARHKVPITRIWPEGARRTGTQRSFQPTPASGGSGVGS
jgi:hypothetical protein